MLPSKVADIPPLWGCQGNWSGEWVECHVLREKGKNFVNPLPTHIMLLNSICWIE